MCKIIFLVAVASNGVMGCAGGLPWYYPEDIQRFKRITMGHPIIMGRKTWDILPKKPLEGRENIVLTKSGRFEDHRCHVYDSMRQAIYDFRDKKIFVIGGAQIFSQYMDFADKLDITSINKDYEGDVIWPGINEDDWHIDKQRISGELTFTAYKRNA